MIGRGKERDRKKKERKRKGKERKDRTEIEEGGEKCQKELNSTHVAKKEEPSGREEGGDKTKHTGKETRP